VSRRTSDAKYGKIVNRREKYKAHVEDHDYPKKVTINEGDKVRIAETKPASKDKRWRVVEVIERTKGV
jgi:small subunit ribosomal protein S17